MTINIQPKICVSGIKASYLIFLIMSTFCVIFNIQIILLFYMCLDAAAYMDTFRCYKNIRGGFYAGDFFIPIYRAFEHVHQMLKYE